MTKYSDTPHIFTLHNPMHPTTNAVAYKEGEKPLTGEAMLKSIKDSMDAIGKIKKIEPKRLTIEGIEVIIAASPFKLDNFSVSLVHPTFTDSDKKCLDIVMKALEKRFNLG